MLCIINKMLTHLLLIYLQRFTVHKMILNLLILDLFNNQPLARYLKGNFSIVVGPKVEF